MSVNIIRVIFWAGWIFASFFILSSPAYAWGPGAHLDSGLFVLENLVLLAPAIRKLISSHPFAFAYGLVAPDIVLGKRYMRPEHNNHRWAVGFRILESARGAREECFAMGYLGHLAADTVAHNHFIPDRLIQGFNRRRRGHMVQELMFDAMVDDQVWSLARIACRRPFRECDALMHSNLTGTPLPQGVNLRLFQSGMMFVRMGGWEMIIKRVRIACRRELDSEAVVPYRDSIRMTVIDFLNDPESAPCRESCPTGGEVLPEALRLRTRLKVLDRLYALPHADYISMVGDFREWRDRAAGLPLTGPLAA